MSILLKLLNERNLSIFLLIGLLAVPSAFSYAAENGMEEEHDEEHEEEVVEIDEELARELGIETTIAGPGTIAETVLLYGKTVSDPQQVSHVSARYPGMIQSIVPALGDSVEAGQVIVSIEANESLRSYDIRAPISGIVIEKHANPGELALAASLLTIANYSNIWVDLTVFPGEARRIRPGLPVTISMDGLEADSSISYLNPTESDSPVVIARVPLANPELVWTPGLLVEGYVQVASIQAEVVIDNSALQTFEEQRVVFVKDGEHYEPRAVSLGRTDGRITEVLTGLEPGEAYVTENSYLLKADLEKDGVEHDH